MQKWILALLAYISSTSVLASETGSVAANVTSSLGATYKFIILVCYLIALTLILIGIYKLGQYSRDKKAKTLRNSFILFVLAFALFTLPSVLKPSAPDWNPQARPPIVPIYVQAAVEDPNCIKLAFPQAIGNEVPEGVTTLSFLIESDGRVTGGKINNSSGNKALDNAAIDGLKKCKFQPAKVNNLTVYSWTVFEYVWKRDASLNVNPLVALPQGNNQPPNSLDSLFYETPKEDYMGGVAT